MTTLENLKREAKRWLKALRSSDRQAHERLRRTNPNGPEVPVLRDVQHALALERGAESWKALCESLDQKPATEQLEDHSRLVDRFIEYACWDHHTHGKGDHRMYDRAAQRMLEQHPEIARDSIYTAVVCGDVDEVKRIIAEDARAATEPGGPKGWPPILYLCFTRFTNSTTIENAVDIARLLLDQGADPNSFYMAGDAKYSALVGAAGGGEQDSPRQPQSEALFELLLDRGAGPYDIQVLYNTHFSADVFWWLELTYKRCLELGLKSDWDEPTWSMLDMQAYGPGAYFLLNVAIEKRDLKLAEWVLSHGGRTNVTSFNPRFRPKLTLYQDAVLNQLPEMAELFVRYGASPTPVTLEGKEKFIAACFRMDLSEVQSEVAQHPEYLRSTDAIFAAAHRDRADVVALLLDLGVPLEIENSYKQRTLHQAAANNALEVARLLIERGAEVDPRETQWGATPIGWASHGDHTEMIDFLSKYSRNVWTLGFRGHVDRLRKVLDAEPERAKAVTDEGVTPLWWLPDDEETALQIVNLYLASGADPNSKNRSGSTAAEWARKRGMLKVVARLESAMVPTTAKRTAVGPQLQRYEELAGDLVRAYESGFQPALDHLNNHYRTSLSWDELRTLVQQHLKMIPKSEMPMSEMYEGYFALPHAQLLVARQAGFASWEELRRQP